MSKLGKQERFVELLERHKKILHKVAYSYTRDPEQRRDLAQEILLQLWRSFDRFDPNLVFSTWMYRVALNVAISFQRREFRRGRDRAEPGAALEEVAAPEPESDDLRLLHALIDRLDPLNKALVLLYLEGNRHEAIAEILGISSSNVATKLSRIKEQLARDVAGVPQPKERK